MKLKSGRPMEKSRERSGGQRRRGGERRKATIEFRFSAFLSSSVLLRLINSFSTHAQPQSLEVEPLGMIERVGMISGLPEMRQHARLAPGFKQRGPHGLLEAGAVHVLAAGEAPEHAAGGGGPGA